MSRFYLTTAIDYANGDPHLGHALEKIGADVVARWHRLRGDDVHFLMGMDEHGQKVARASAKAGVPAQEWVDRISAHFEGTWRSLLCSHDDWMRTTQPRHAEGVTSFLRQMQARSPDDLFVQVYEGLYVVGAEEFVQESELVDGVHPEHPNDPPIVMREENVFFRLSRYRDELHRRITSGELVVEPQIRRNEVLRVLEGGLHDISISRARIPWGIPFPGREGDTVYVWYDALLNYLTAIGAGPAPGRAAGTSWSEHPADVHVIGKGISRFHCIIWPAMLLSAGFPLPRKVWIHGYVTWSGAKMSKSAGTAVTVEEARDRHGADALRWFLMRDVGFENDGDFSWERFDARYTADLADGLGNLASRSLAMLDKYRAGVVPARGEATPLDAAGERAAGDYAAAMEAIDLKGGAAAVGDLVGAANQYIVQVAPWALAKQGDDAALDTALAALARALYRLAVMVAPFMPGKAAALWRALGQPGEPGPAGWAAMGAPPVGGAATHKPENLFPKPAAG